MGLFVRRRTNDAQPLLRPYFVRLGYEVCGGTDWRQIAPACAAAELFNISTYQANVAFDGKLTVKTQEQRAEQFACSMISMGLANDVLMGCSVAPGVVNRISLNLQHVNSEIYRGQLLDLRVLNLNAITGRSDFDELYRLYELRCRLLGGELTAWCFSTGAVLAGANGQDVSVLTNVGLLMGTAGQMVNDIGDFVPLRESQSHNESERYQLPFSDLLSGKATFPVLYAFEAGDRDACHMLVSVWHGEMREPVSLLRLTERLNVIGAFSSAQRIIGKHTKAVRKAIRLLPNSAARDYLLLSVSSLTHNKYFSYLRQKDHSDISFVSSA